MAQAPHPDIRGPSPQPWRKPLRARRRQARSQAAHSLPHPPIKHRDWRALKQREPAYRAGRLNASVAQLPYLMGIRAVEDSKRALAGEKLPEFVDVPTLLLTKDVIEADKEPMLQYVK